MQTGLKGDGDGMCMVEGWGWGGAVGTGRGQSHAHVQHTLRVIEAARPPFRHQTNVAYTPMAALKHADPSGALITDAFYKLVFKYDTVLRFSLRAIRLLRWKAQKVKAGVRLLGFK